MQQVDQWAIVKIDNFDDFPSIFQTTVISSLCNPQGADPSPFPQCIARQEIITLLPTGIGEGYSQTI
jgi:hypothetical protein